MNLLRRAKTIVQSGRTIAVLQVSKVRGSAPREVGAMMVVTENGILGSIGGGTLEWKALAEAQRLLVSGPSTNHATYALGPDLGQCCGGQVEVVTRVFDASNAEAMADQDEHVGRRVYLFGAGHVGKALVFTLAQTGFDVMWCDPRPGAFPTHIPANVTLRHDQNSSAIVADAPAGSIAFVMSHSHALDLAIVDSCLRNPNIATTGLIGSATKRARFENRLAAAGVASFQIAALICPIGIGGIRSKRPEAIAISVAAQLIALDESLSIGKTSTPEFSELHEAAS